MSCIRLKKQTSLIVCLFVESFGTLSSRISREEQFALVESDKHNIFLELTLPVLVVQLSPDEDNVNFI